MKWILSLLVLFCFSSVHGQTAEELVRSVQEKLNRVSTYRAEGILKTNVAFIKAPVAEIVIFFKKPGKLKITNKKGVSFIPKGAGNISVSGLIQQSGDFDIVDAGKDASGLRIVRLLPRSETSDVVLSTLYIDEQLLLIRKAKTTTRDNGTNELELIYGKHAGYGLPDRVIFVFNTKDYKMLKGVAVDYEGSAKKQTPEKDKKGKVEITYKKYEINKPISDSIFN